jgi:hypothetical protein
MATNSNNVTGWVGWAYFAGFMMIILGSFQAIVGLTALLKKSFYVVTQSHLLVFNYNTWGWIQLLVGILIIVTGSSLMQGRMWARVVGSVLIILNLIAQFTFINVYPIWSIIMMVVDALILYAITVHGHELA